MKLFRYQTFKLSLISLFVLVVGLVAFQDEALGTTFATGQGTGGLELKIDSIAYYNGVLQPALSWEVKDLVPESDNFFKFGDVKPGDTGITTISLHVKKNPAWVCLDFLNVEDFENGLNEPESIEDVNDEGELSSELEFFAWFDDGDQEFEVGEKPLFGTTTQAAKDVLKGQSYFVSDGSPIQPNQTEYIGVFWCAGDLMVDLSTATLSCDAEAMGNEAQTDSMTLDVSLRAVSAHGTQNYSCRVPDVPDPCEHEFGNNGHGNDDDHNDDSNPGSSNDEDDDTDDDGVPPGFSKKNPSEDCPPRGNNGHGNDDDHNDDSNPGSSNDEDDDTDDDGMPPGFGKKDDNHNNDSYAQQWFKPSKEKKNGRFAWFGKLFNKGSS